MALDKKALQKLLDNPAMFSAADMEQESIDDALQQKVEGSEQEPQPMEMEDEDMGEEMVASAAPVSKMKPSYEVSPEIMELMKKMKGPESLEDVEVEKEQMDEPSLDLKKKAIQQIRQKYLGQ